MVSEFTTVEIFSAFGTHCRKNKYPLSKYKKMEQAFWQDVAEGRIMIKEASYQDFQRARHLLQHAGVDKSRKITSADAIIAAVALGLALEQAEVVTFCVEDWPLYSIIREIKAYTSVLAFKFIGVEKAPVSGSA